MQKDVIENPNSGAFHMINNQGAKAALTQMGFLFTVLRRIIVLVLCATFLGLLSTLVNPHAPHWGKGRLQKGEITIETLKPGTNYVWVDAREPDDFKAAHVRGAYNVCPSLFYAQINQFTLNWTTGQPILVYCSEEECFAAESTARSLRSTLGTDQVFVIHGGWQAIVENGTIPMQ
jgi:rhodanese-related sulfurtransferase